VSFDVTKLWPISGAMAKNVRGHHDSMHALGYVTADRRRDVPGKRVLVSLANGLEGHGTIINFFKNGKISVQIDGWPKPGKYTHGEVWFMRGAP